jgi:hypothetical protein
MENKSRIMFTSQEKLGAFPFLAVQFHTAINARTARLLAPYYRKRSHLL